MSVWQSMSRVSEKGLPLVPSPQTLQGGRSSYFVEASSIIINPVKDFELEESQPGFNRYLP